MRTSPSTQVDVRGEKERGVASSQYTYDLFPIAPSLRSFSHCGAHVPIIYADMYFAKVPSLQTLMNL